MRRILAILLAISLSWVTTGYACQMAGLKPHARCHCPHTPGDVHAGKDGIEAANGERMPCCNFVAQSALDEQQPGLLPASSGFDLPAFVSVPDTGWQALTQAARSEAAALPARGPPANGRLIYLDTARLRI
jgi:hypothetical protein